ncbi:UNVERIFIED_ORG: signal transduction histidine kinase/FixJ family two-component response regulator [Variovorax paradoxus]|nr:signal transduction histidine kinase/FixJ family two-component response regulator [Variovorax paradoxus]
MTSSETSAAPSTDGTSLDQRVLREHLASVYADLDAAVLGHIGTSAALIVFIYARQQVIGIQFVCLVAWHVAVQLVTYSSARWTRAEPMAATFMWVRRYTWSSAVMSSSTLPLTVFFISREDQVLTTLISLAVLGTCTRGLQARWPFKAAMFSYFVPPTVGLLGSLIWHGGLLGWVLACFCAVNFALALRAGLVQNRRVTESLMLRFENEALAARLKEQIEATERASAEKTRFLAAASHDLRQPMHAIALFGATMQNALHDHPESRNAERLMRAVHTLGNSLDTMLDVSRLDAGIVAPDLRALELDAMFLVLNQTFSAQAEQKGLDLRVRASGLWVRSDVQLLYRLLSNLIDNALKYTHKGGVSVTARARGEAVRVEVRDTGIGIATEQLERIFEEFYQVDNPGRDRARGLGIGLSIVKRLSRLLAHPVTVHSRFGRGTRFRLVVPAAEQIDEPQTDLLLQDLEAPVRHRFAAPELHGRLLLIDDEAEIRAAMTELLNAYSVDVLAVADEAQAVAALSSPDAKQRPFAMLLCDYRLAGGEDGLEAGLRLRERFHLDVPLLLITGETSPERLQRARASGVPMLFKPVSAATLLQAVADLAAADIQQRAAPMARNDIHHFRGIPRPS